MTTVLIADDQVLIRSAVRELVDRADGMQVVGEAADGHEAVDLARRLRPDVVLMDIRMPLLDGIAATRQICADPELGDVRVLVLTTFEEDAFIVEALRAGAGGFIGKGAEHAEILHAIACVHRGDALLSPRATRSLIDRFVSADPQTQVRTALPPADLAELTPREVEVLTMVGRGLSNAEIAEAFVISPHTTKTHVGRIMTKLYAHDRAQLVIAAYENGLVRAGASD